MKRLALFPAILAAAILVCGFSQVQSSKEELDRVAAELGLESLRGIDYDICFPNSPEEYEKLGKNAIILIKASAAVSTELPIKSTYIAYGGEKFNLHKIYTTEI